MARCGTTWWRARDRLGRRAGVLGAVIALAAVVAQPVARGDDGPDDDDLSDLRDDDDPVGAEQPTCTDDDDAVDCQPGRLDPGWSEPAEHERPRACTPGQTPADDKTVVIDCVEKVVPGLDLRNWRQTKKWKGKIIPRFKRSGKVSSPKQINQITLHETGGTTQSGALGKLVKSGYGVHFVVDKDGRVTHHMDLTERVVHDNLSVPSIGIEVVAPVTGKGAWPTARFGAWLYQNVIKQTQKQYRPPTLDQMKALDKLVRWLVAQPTMNLSKDFPAVDWSEVKSPRKVPHWMAGGELRKPRGGILAHCQITAIKDGDGLFPEIYLWLRWHCSGTDRQIYDHARTVMASKMKWRKTSRPWTIDLYNGGKYPGDGWFEKRLWCPCAPGQIDDPTEPSGCAQAETPRPSDEGDPSDEGGPSDEGDPGYEGGGDDGYDGDDF